MRKVWKNHCANGWGFDKSTSSGQAVQAWTGGREKAPVAICRKVADMVEGIYLLMQSDLEEPVNIGCPQYVTVDELAATVMGEVTAVAFSPLSVRSRCITIWSS